MAIKKYGYGYARKKRLLKWEEDEENLFKKNHNPEENKKKNLHLQTGKNMAFSGRASHKSVYQIYHPKKPPLTTCSDTMSSDCCGQMGFTGACPTYEYDVTVL